MKSRRYILLFIILILSSESLFAKTENWLAFIPSDKNTQTINAIKYLLIDTDYRHGNPVRRFKPLLGYNEGGVYFKDRKVCVWEKKEKKDKKENERFIKESLCVEGFPLVSFLDEVGQFETRIYLSDEELERKWFNHPYIQLGPYPGFEELIAKIKHISQREIVISE